VRIVTNKNGGVSFRLAARKWSRVPGRWLRRTFSRTSCPNAIRNLAGDPRDNNSSVLDPFDPFRLLLPLAKRYFSWPGRPARSGEKETWRNLHFRRAFQHLIIDNAPAARFGTARKSQAESARSLPHSRWNSRSSLTHRSYETAKMQNARFRPLPELCSIHTRVTLPSFSLFLVFFLSRRDTARFSRRRDLSLTFSERRSVNVL